MKNKTSLIFPNTKKEKCGIITSLILGFISLAYEGISSFLHHIRHEALHKVVKAMETKAHIQCNKLMHLEDSLVIYGVYTTETLEKLLNTVHVMHNSTTPNVKLFT